MIKGKISSVESAGLVDGPGIRYVVFMQGCKLRCLYCHNPETWELNKQSFSLSAIEIVDKIERFKPYYGESGGVTFSGGEPLLQPEFLLECLKECKKRGINTAIDTAGVGFGKYEELLKYTDLVILDIKSSDEDMYKKITGQSMVYFKQFLDCAIKNNSKFWIRQVIVPGLNDTEDNIKNLAEYIRIIPNIQRIELLPYHSLCKNKYKMQNLVYRLGNLPDMDEEKCKKLENLLKNKLQFENLQ